MLQGIFNNYGLKDKEDKISNSVIKVIGCKPIAYNTL